MSLPVVDYLKLPEGEDPYLEGHKCNNCGSIFLGERNVCSKCFARDTIEPIKLNNKGKLYSYSIVFRSFPGIEVPYISAIVDLDGGGTVKGNLIDCEPDPEKIILKVEKLKLIDEIPKSISIPLTLSFSTYKDS